MFKEYRQAYDKMNANHAIQYCKQAIAFYQASLQILEQPYRDTMAAAETQIVQAVLDTKKTTTLFGVIAKFSKARTTVSWKSVAQALKPPKELVQKFSTVHKPKVAVRIAG